MRAASGLDECVPHELEVLAHASVVHSELSGVVADLEVAKEVSGERSSACKIVERAADHVAQVLSLQALLRIGKVLLALKDLSRSVHVRQHQGDCELEIREETAEQDQRVSRKASRRQRRAWELSAH